MTTCKIKRQFCLHIEFLNLAENRTKLLAPYLG